MRKVLGVVVCAALLAAGRLAAQDSVSLGLTVGADGRVGIVVLPVNWSGGDSIYAIVANDLKNSDRFNVIPLGAGAVPDTGAKDYTLYAKLGASLVVQLAPTPFGVHANLHQVKTAQVSNQKTFELPAATGSPEWRMAVHDVSDEIELWVYGRRGIAQSRVVFGRPPAAGGGLWIVDSDGANERQIASETVYSPTWGALGQTVAYSRWGESGYSLVLRDLVRGGPPRVLSTGLGGTSVSARFKPPGETVVWWQVNTRSVLYEASAVERSTPKSLLAPPGTLNTGLAFDPKGQRMVFVSNRAGAADVYIADVDGTNAEPLIRTPLAPGAERNDPDWSPDGRLVVFGALSSVGGWQIALTDAATRRAPRVLTDVGSNEDPSWAPDSRHLVFKSDRSGVTQLWVLDTETGATRQLTRRGGVRNAAWSPPLGAPGPIVQSEAGGAKH